MTGQSDRVADALAWADEHNAVLRFNGNEEHEGRSFRCTVVGHQPDDRILAIRPVSPEGDLLTVIVETISEVRIEHEATARRRHLQVVAGHTGS